MKPAVADRRYRVYCLRIEPALAGAPTIYLTSYPHNLTMTSSPATVYVSGSGFQFTGYQAAANLAPGMVDLEGLAGVVGMDRDDIVNGVFDNARCSLFATTWHTPIEDEEPIVRSILGKAQLQDDRYVIQEFALVDALSQTVGRTCAPTCDNVFGGQEFAGCGVDLGPITVVGTLTSITSRSVVVDNTRAEAADYFGLGLLTFTSGPNAGLPPKMVKSFAAGGTITTYEPWPFTPTIGDAYSMTPGCRKRLEDCRDKWNNVPRFGGFTFVPVGSKYSEIGTK